MSDRPPIAALEYAQPAVDDVRRLRILFGSVAVAAMVMGATGCLMLVGFLYQTATGIYDLRTLNAAAWVSIVGLAGGPMLVVSAFLALSALRHPERARRAAVVCAITGAFGIAILVVLMVMQVLALSDAVMNPRSPLTSSFVSPGSIRAMLIAQAGACASFLCLFLPLLLIGAKSAWVWRNRLLAVAAVASLLAGLQGTSVLLWKAASKQNLVGGTYESAMQASLRDPAPIIGLWPTAGLAAAALFAISIWHPRHAMLAFAVLLAVIYQLTLSGRQFSYLFGLGGIGMSEPYFVAQAILAIRDTIANLLPAALIAWTLRKDRDWLLPAPVKMLEP